MEQNLKTLIILLKTSEMLRLNAKKSLELSQLTLNEFAALEALYTKRELTTQALINTVLIPNSSMTYVLDCLKKRNYIQGVRNTNDKRIQYLSLTPYGHEQFKNVYDMHYKHMQSIFDVLTEDEEYLLQELLKRVGHTAEEVLYDPRHTQRNK